MTQPLVVVVPTLFTGMLLGRVPFLESLMVVVLLTAVSVVANILAGMIAIVVSLSSQN